MLGGPKIVSMDWPLILRSFLKGNPGENMWARRQKSHRSHSLKGKCNLKQPGDCPLQGPQKRRPGAAGRGQARKEGRETGKWQGSRRYSYSFREWYIYLHLQIKKPAQCGKICHTWMVRDSCLRAYFSWSSWSCLLGIHRAFCFDLAALGSHWSRYIHAAPCSYIQLCLLENMFTWFGSSSTCNIETRISRALSITSSLPLSTERYLRAFLLARLVMEKHELAFKVGETIAIGSSYIVVSAGLITFNKYLMQRGHFPHALQLTALHMSMTTFFSLILCTTIPSIYPSMSKAKENWKQLCKFMVPLGILFAVALFASNKAYFYSSVAFLQFCKAAGNVAGPSFSPAAPLDSENFPGHKWWFWALWSWDAP